MVQGWLDSQKIDPDLRLKVLEVFDSLRTDSSYPQEVSRLDPKLDRSVRSRGWGGSVRLKRLMLP